MSQFAKYFNTKLDLMHQEPLTKKENLAFYLKTNSAPALKFTKMMSDKGSLHQPTVREDVIKKWKNGISLIKKLQLSKLFKKKEQKSSVDLQSLDVKCQTSFWQILSLLDNTNLNN